MSPGSVKLPASTSRLGPAGIVQMMQPGQGVTLMAD
jgi:hypothetical protein